MVHLEVWRVLDSELMHICQPGREVRVVPDALSAALEQRCVAPIVANDGRVHPQVGLCKPACHISQLATTVLDPAAT